jgi:glycogen(starch) synthase
MFGWELPPYNSGGLGTASLGMTQGLAARGVDIDFVLPHNAGPYPYKHMRILSASNNETDEQPLLQPMPYGSSLAFDEHGRASIRYQSGGSQATPYLQATWYAQAVRPLVQPSNYAMIHAHDWMTYYSAMQARTTARKWGIQTPLVAHIHATEYDRGGEHGGNQAIATIERTALQAADRVIAVSHYTAQMVHKHYDVTLIPQCR